MKLVFRQFLHIFLVNIFDNLCVVKHCFWPFYQEYLDDICERLFNLKGTVLLIKETINKENVLVCKFSAKLYKIILL